MSQSGDCRDLLPVVQQYAKDMDALEIRITRACELLLQSSADVTKLLGHRAALLLALKQLSEATQGILGVCDPELRQAAGHPAVNAIYKALWDADLAVAAVEVGA